MIQELDRDFVFRLGEPARVRRMAKRGIVVKRDMRWDARHAELCDAYRIEFPNGNGGWFFHWELQVTE